MASPSHMDGSQVHSKQYDSCKCTQYVRWHHLAHAIKGVLECTGCVFVTRQGKAGCEDCVNLAGLCARQRWDSCLLQLGPTDFFSQISRMEIHRETCFCLSSRCVKFVVYVGYQGNYVILQPLCLARRR